jgi:Gly-Xaa carboxypeptidase
LAQIITTVEDNPFPLFAFEANPIIGQLKCVGEHTDLLSSFQKFALNHFSVSLPYIYHWFSGVPMLKASISTTQSTDIISGGIKVNAIPTSTFAVVNIRINPASNVKEVSDRLSKMVEPIAKMHNLGLASIVHGHQIFQSILNDTETVGKIKLDFHASLEPSPITPTDTATFAKFSSVIRRVFNNVTVSPGLMVYFSTHLDC